MKYVIIGHGAAGASAAETIRNQDPHGDIHLFTDEEYPFYYRPKLIYFLSGGMTPEHLVIRDEKWFAGKGITLHLRERVVKLDPTAKRITTSQGVQQEYDRLLLANGSDPFLLPIPGIEHPQVYTLRTIHDAELIRAKAEASKQAIIIGAGLLGLEAGHSLLQQGLGVTVLDRDPYLLPRQLDREGGELLGKLLESRGYRFILPAQITAIQGDERPIVVLANGQTIEADFILLSVGIKANLGLAQQAGLTCNRGVIVNDLLQTSNPDIFAAGDLIEHQGRGYGLWLPAKQQGEIAGFNMAGGEREYHGSTPSHKLKVAGVDVVALGQIHGEELTPVLVKHTETVYRKLFHQNHILKGALLIGEVEDQSTLAKAIAHGEMIDSHIRMN